MNSLVRFKLALSLLIILSALAGNALAEPEILAKGLMNSAAVLSINGRQRFLKQGQSSPEGVRLIASTTRLATVEYAGKQYQIGLSQRVGAKYSEPKADVVRLASQRNGHYFGTANIRGHSVGFMVDTGASSISMSSDLAERIGLGYKTGELIRVSTAQGATLAHEVRISEVKVGGISVRNAKAIVIDGSYPIDMLLGNSFLAQVDMRVEQGIMVLQSRIIE